VFLIKKVVDYFQNVIYDWSYNCGYIDVFYDISLIMSVRKLVKFNYFFDKKIIDAIPNEIGITSFFYGRGYQICRRRANFFIYFIVYILYSNLYTNLVFFIY